MLEQGIQAKIIKNLEANNFYVVNVITASKKGVTDIIACSPIGQFWSIEVKRPGFKPSKLQYWNLNQVKKRHGVSFYADSYDDFRQKFTEQVELQTRLLKQ